jgi:hypothetical protein
MSRRVLLVVVLVAWLLATLVAPAVTGSPVANDGFSVEVEGGAEAWSEHNSALRAHCTGTNAVGTSAYAWLPPMQLEGDSECGGSGGCPNLF